ncbi:hypothetical protein J6590_003780 [Homalodisca vitripennis]|nr:hypothetical protein J6590_003780 [Homalodisca vitripennis]
MTVVPTFRKVDIVRKRYLQSVALAALSARSPCRALSRDEAPVTSPYRHNGSLMSHVSTHLPAHQCCQQCTVLDSFHRDITLQTTHTRQPDLHLRLLAVAQLGLRFEAGCLHGQDRSAATHPSSSHNRCCLIWLSCDNRCTPHYTGPLRSRYDKDLLSEISGNVNFIKGNSGISLELDDRIKATELKEKIKMSKVTHVLQLGLLLSPAWVVADGHRVPDGTHVDGRRDGRGVRSRRLGWGGRGGAGLLRKHPLDQHQTSHTDQHSRRHAGSSLADTHQHYLQHWGGLVIIHMYEEFAYAMQLPAVQIACATVVKKPLIVATRLEDDEAYERDLVRKKSS